MRRLAASLLGLMALGACSASHTQHAAVTTPSSSGSPLTIASQARTGPSPVVSPSANLPVTAVGFSCKLPVMFGQHEFEFTGGFISFPSATYQADPNGALSGSPDNTYVTKASPVLHGSGGWPFYDLAMRRWLPVPPGEASPDGRSYAYIVPAAPGSNPTAVHVVQIATGTDHVISIGLPPGGVGWQVEDFSGGAVLIAGQRANQFPAGVWRLDVASGSLHELTPAGHVLLVQNGTAWIGINNPADPSPRVVQVGEAFDSIAAVNLSTGAETTWMYEPGMSVQVLAVDEFGRLVAAVTAPPDFSATGIVFYQSPGSVGDVVTANGTRLFLVEPDRGQLWFGSGDGIYFWTSVTGFQKVYAIQGETTGPGQAIVPAGHCV
jgi:hypothetical protein